MSGTEAEARDRARELWDACSAETLDFTRKATADFPGSAVLAAWNAWELISRGRYEEAEAESDRACALDGACAPALAAAAKAALRVADMDKAKSAYERARAADPDELFVFMVTSDLATFAGVELDVKAEEDRFVERWPDLVAAFHSKVSSARLRLDPSVADLVAEMAARWPDHPRTLYVQVVQAKSEQDVHRAMALAERLLEVCPHHEEGLCEMAFFQQLSGKLEASESLVLKCLETNPHHYQGLATLAAIREKQGDAKQARRLRDKADRSLPLLAFLRTGQEVAGLLQRGKAKEALKRLEGVDVPPSTYAKITHYKMLAVCAGQIQDWAKVRSALEELQGVGERSPQTVTLWATLLEAEGNRDQAIETLEAARLEFPRSGSILASLLRALDSSGKRSAADDIARDLVNDPGSSPAECGEMFMALDKSGRLDEAQSVLAQSLLRFPDDKTLQLLEGVKALERGDPSLLVAATKDLPKPFRRLTLMTRIVAWLMKASSKKRRR